MNRHPRRKPMRLWWTVSLLMAGALAGCADPEPQRSLDPEQDAPEALTTGLLRGVVVDMAIRPVATAEVVLRLEDSEVAILTTDVEGRWGIGSLEAGTYEVLVSKPGYQQTNATGVVVAGEQTPEPIQIILPALPVDTAFVWPIVWDGVVACGATPQNYCAGLNLATGTEIFNDQSFKFLFDDFMAYERTPDFMQAEFVWDPNAEVSQYAYAAFWASTWEEWDSCLCTPNLFATQGGSSYILVQADRATFEELDVGFSQGVGVGFSVGTGSDENMQDPSTYSVMFNQPFQGFFHVFYGCLPPDDWRFTIHGDPACDPETLEAT